MTKPLKIIGEKVKPLVSDIGESELAQKIGKKVSETEETLLENTNVYQYGGFKDREARERSKLRRQESSAAENPLTAAQASKVEANPR